MSNNKKFRPSFTMEDWDDERLARKHIRPSMDDIRQRLKDDGIKTRFTKERDEQNGIQSYAIFYEQENGGYSDRDYLAIHFEPSRKLPGGRRPRNKDDAGNSSKKRKGSKRQNKMRKETD